MRQRPLIFKLSCMISKHHFSTQITQALKGTVLSCLGQPWRLFSRAFYAFQGSVDSFVEDADHQSIFLNSNKKENEPREVSLLNYFLFKEYEGSEYGFPNTYLVVGCCNDEVRHNSKVIPDEPWVDADEQMEMIHPCICEDWFHKVHISLGNEAWY
ncbi:hypothetical protein L1887_25966 [Cichorium endivia]|nr:hypothetical protein L1887_25966 [Cichorium endivia]